MAILKESSNRRTKKGRTRFSVTLDNELAYQADELAKKMRNSRAGIIELALSQLFKDGLKFEGDSEKKEDSP